MNTLLAIGLFFSSSFVFAQTTEQSFIPEKRTCGTEVPGEAWDQWFNAKVQEFKEQRAAGKVQSAAITIPVIVHVIHGGQAVGTNPNISQAQINSQIPVLNNDFAGTGYNVNNLSVTAFSAVGAANSNITFCLAEKDPNGNSLSQPGIDRINYTSKGWTNPASFSSATSFINYMNGTIKPNSIWDPTRYLNIWVSDVSNAAGLLGFATFPAGSGLSGISGSTGTSSTDGVWVWCRSFGNLSGSVQSPYNRGRTATHEIGHWLGLRHINGDAACGNDFCNDTPVQQALNFGCPTYPKISCGNGPNGEMFMNFMDYCDDACLYMFTPDQDARIQTAMLNSPFRNQLNASSATVCNVPAVAPVAGFTLASNTICRDTSMVPGNQSTGSPGPTYSWVASPSLGVTFVPNHTSANPSITFAYPGFYTLSLVATNTLGSSNHDELLMVLDCADGVGLNESRMGAESIRLYPNPGKGHFTLQSLSTYSGESQIRIINSLGQCVIELQQPVEAGREIDLKLDMLKPGVYLLSMQAGPQQFRTRLVVEN